MELQSSSFDLLDHGLALHIFSYLSARQVAAASLTCKLFQHLTSQASLWKQLYQKEAERRTQCSALHSSIEPVQKPDEAGPSALDWRELVKSAVSLRDLHVASWEEVNPTTSPGGAKARPCAREGHAASSWGKDSLIMFGGWGCGIRNDLFILDKSMGGVDGAEYQWRTVAVAGQRPAIRYGHSVTRCGPNWDMLLVYGGMQSGGYLGEIEELAVLRPYCARDSAACGQGSTSLRSHSSGLASGSLLAAASEAQMSLSGGGSRASSGSGVSQAAADRALGGQQPEYEYEWFEPELHGARPKRRGYHAACASPDGRRVYLFGGMARHDCCNTLAVVNVETWEVEQPTTHGIPPQKRFGCSMAVWDGGLWVVGGGCGHDLGRSGYDLQDVWRLDLTTWTWEEPELANQVPDSLVLGRCHAYCLVGSKLVLFGGSKKLGNDVTWLDLATRKWGQPCITGTPPAARMSAVMVPSGSHLLVYGGWIYSIGEMGDLFRLNCDPSEQERADIRHLVKEHASDAAGSKVKAKEAPQVARRRSHAGQDSSCGGVAGPSCPAVGPRHAAQQCPALQEQPSKGRGGKVGSGSGSSSGQATGAPAAATTTSSSSSSWVVPTDAQEENGVGLLPRGLLGARVEPQPGVTRLWNEFRMRFFPGASAEAFLKLMRGGSDEEEEEEWEEDEDEEEWETDGEEATEQAAGSGEQEEESSSRSSDDEQQEEEHTAGEDKAGQA